MHSEAYRAAMAELQRFRAVPLSEQARVRVRVRVRVRIRARIRVRSGQG